MNFSIQQLKELTFRRSFLFGYKKADVEDFVRHILEDYDTYIEKDSVIERLEKQVSSKKATLSKKNKEIEEIETEKNRLKDENERLQGLELEKQKIDQMRKMAQETANRVEKEAQNIFERAQEEGEQLLKTAEEERLHALMDLQLELGELNKEQMDLLTQLESKKQELTELNYQCRELGQWKEKTEQEVAVFKQELSTIKEQLMAKYEESLEAFLEENLRFKRIEETTKEQPVVQLHAKKIG